MTKDGVFTNSKSFYIRRDQKKTVDGVKKGDLTDFRVSRERPVDKIILYGLKEGFIRPGLNAFPDPRKNVEVPIDVILLAQILRSLNDEHSLLLAPYMLNSAKIITELGYNIGVLKSGFNERAKFDRQTCFHGETLKHLLLAADPSRILNWFNQDWLKVWREHAPGQTRFYILDGTKILIPPHLVHKFQGAGTVKDSDGNVFHGYKVVFLHEIIDRKGIMVSIKIGPIQTHDLVLGKELVRDFPFEEDSCLIMDRGFIDGAWMNELKQKRNIDVAMPLKRNMQIVQAAVSTADNRQAWIPHPIRKDQKMYPLFKDDLYWEECPLIKSGVLVRWHFRDGTPHDVLFVTTRAKTSAKMLLSIYDLRAEIEEGHRQLKCFQGLETLPSKKFSQVVFRIVIGVLGYNFLNLFLNSEGCRNLEELSLKTLRQKDEPEKNPEVIIYNQSTFATMRQYEFFPLILTLKKKVRQKLSATFHGLDTGPPIIIKN